MTRLTTLLMVLVLAACSGRPAGTPERDLQWRTSVRGDEIRVVLFDRTGSYRIDRIALVGPSGQEVQAREMTRESQSGGKGPSFGLGGDYGSRGGGSLGVGMSLPLDTDYSPAIDRRTSAVIPMPNGYTQNPAQWRIEVEMTMPGGGPYHATLPAPTS